MQYLLIWFGISVVVQLVEYAWVKHNGMIFLDTSSGRDWTLFIVGFVLWPWSLYFMYQEVGREGW